MPLHPPTGSALTAPVYFGLRLKASRVRTPELLRAHLQTVRQTLQCDFIVIPAASANSLAVSKRDAAQKSKNAVESFAEDARDIRITDSSATSSYYQSPDRCPPIERSDSGTAEERSPFTGPTPFRNITSTIPPNRCPAGKREDACASPLIACPTESIPSAESIVLVESPAFATARATIPAQHLAEAATDLPGFCKRYIKYGSFASRDTRCRSDNEILIERPDGATKEPSFTSLDGGLATLPAVYSFEPSTESDLPLDSQTWSAAVMCELSSWISPDVGVLPRRRRVATVSPTTQASDAMWIANASSPVFTSSSASAASSSPKTCSVAGAAVPPSHIHAGSHCPVTGASPKSCSCYATVCTVASGEGADGCAPQQLLSAAGPQSEKQVKDQEKQTHYNKRSRTAPKGGEMKLSARVDRSGGQNEAALGIEQARSCSHDRQHRHKEAPCSMVSSAEKVSDRMEQDERHNHCSATAQAALPAATAGALERCATASSSGACVRPAVESCEARTGAASALSRDKELASQTRGDSGEAKNMKELHLKHGLLRHWSFHERAWQREMQWATHVGAFAVITPPPRPDLIPVEYSRLLRAALNQLQPPIIWVKLPLVYCVGSQSGANFLSSSSSSPSSDNSSQSSDSKDMRSEDMNAPSSSSGHSGGRYSSRKGGSRRRHQTMRNTRSQTRKKIDPWRIWQYIRSMVGPHPSLGVCLELTPDLPDSDSELERWFAEPLRAVVLPSSLFTTSSSCDSSCGIFGSSSRNSSSANTFRAPRGKGRGGNKGSPLTCEATASAKAGGSGVCLSPRHHLFLMKCAQHRVKLIFQPDDDEEDEGTLDAEQAGYASLFQSAERHQQVGQLTREHYPSLSAAVGCTASKQHDSGTLATSTGIGKGHNTRTTCCIGGILSTQKGEHCKKKAPPLEETQPYILYVAQQLLQLPPLKQTDLFSAPYRDVLQSPMQPLADNLSAGNYEVFEKDPVKYLRYKEATLVRLREIWPDTTAKQQEQQPVRTESQGYQTMKKQQEEERGKLVKTQQGRGLAALTAIGSSIEDASLQSVEAQRKRTKSRRRKHGRSACNRTSSWEYEDEDDEEEFEEPEHLSDSSTSVNDVTPLCAPGGACSFFPSAASSLSPAPLYLPCASPSISSSSKFIEADRSDWCLRGAGCTMHAAAGHRLVLTIVGAGRGPLVQAALEALREAGIPLCRTRVFAVEKNWNAVITLRSRVRNDPCLGWRAVEVVEADMREAGDCVAERADILISELLGSFGDNELSAECLDGAQVRLLKKGGISIPSAYISSLEPVATHTLWQAIESYKDPKQFECTYVVNMFAKYFPSKEGPRECFYFRHPHSLLPFGDEGHSDTEGGSGSRSIRSNTWMAGDSDRSDSEKCNAGKGYAEEGGSSRNYSGCARSMKNTRSTDATAVQQEDVKDGEQITEIVSNTFKRHDKSAEPLEVLHTKESTSGQVQCSEGSAAARCHKQENVRLCAATEPHSTIDDCGKSKEAKLLEKSSGDGIVGDWFAKGGNFACKREKTSKKKVSSKQRCSFTAAELTALRHRRTRLSWRMQTDAVVHGLAGYFHCCLYKNVYISIDPRSFSEGMFSWFPLFIPFRQPVYVHRNEKLEVYIARDGDEHKVWYEWAVLQPTPSEIYNHMGRYSYIGK